MRLLHRSLLLQKNNFEKSKVFSGVDAEYIEAWLAAPRNSYERALEESIDWACGSNTYGAPIATRRKRGWLSGPIGVRYLPRNRRAAPLRQRP
jgi:hypothetical protein